MHTHSHRAQKNMSVLDIIYATQTHVIHTILMLLLKSHINKKIRKSLDTELNVLNVCGLVTHTKGGTLHLCVQPVHNIRVTGGEIHPNKEKPFSARCRSYCNAIKHANFTFQLQNGTPNYLSPLQEVLVHHAAEKSKQIF